MSVNIHVSEKIKSNQPDQAACTQKQKNSMIIIQKPKQEPEKGGKEHSSCFAEHVCFYIRFFILLYSFLLFFFPEEL